MIDFTNVIETLNNYKGSEKKKTLIYDGKKYLVKFLDLVSEKTLYLRNNFSEYIENKIFKLVI